MQELISTQQLIKAITRLARDCGTCQRKMSNFCLEKTCRNEPLFCNYCEPHLVHRTSSINIFLISQDQFESAYLKTKAFFEQQIRRIETATKDYVELFQKAISELDNLHKDYTQGWFSKTLATVQQVYNLKEMEEKEIEGLRTKFQENMSKLELETNKLCVNLIDSLELEDFNLKNKYSPFCYFKENDQITNVSERVRLLLNGLQQSRIEFITKKYFNEQFIKLKKYPEVNEILKGTNRTRLIGFDLAKEYKSQQRIAIYRQSLYGNYTLPKTWHQRNPVYELYLLDVDVQYFPRNLKSLTLSTQSYVSFKNLSILSKLPSTLQVLKLNLFHEGFQNSKKVPYYLDHLTSLRYLVIRDCFLTKEQARAIIQLGIFRSYHMLIFLKERQIRTIQKTPFTKMEAIYQHKFNSLTPHYLAYKRKLIQCQKMHRSALWRTAQHVRQQVLEITKSQWEMNHTLTKLAW